MARAALNDRGMKTTRNAGGNGRGPEAKAASATAGNKGPVYYTHGELRAMGYHQNAIARNVRAGRWTRPLSNFYLLRDSKEYSQSERHRALVRAYGQKFGGARVASHWTAAELWGLPTSIFSQNTMAFTENRPRQGMLRQRYLTVYQRPLGPEDIATVDGVACTSLARTVLDCSLLGSFMQAVCSMESALFFLSRYREPRLRRDELAEQLDRAAGRRHIGQARAAFEFAGTKSQSVFESRMRLFLRHHRIEQPAQQVEFYRSDGSILSIADMAWRDRRKILECDGAGKYLDHLGGLSTAERLCRDRERDRVLHERGFETIRATWRDLDHPNSLLRLLQGARLYSPH